VEFNGAHGKAQPEGHLFVAPALQQKLNDILFAFTELVSRFHLPSVPQKLDGARAW
jgi:hypothetical protein